MFCDFQVLKFKESKDPDNRVADFAKHIKMDMINLQIIVETSPNNGLFEATVSVNLRTGEHQVTADISRINMYGEQPNCVINKFPDLRKFCYCKWHGQWFRWRLWTLHVGPNVTIVTVSDNSMIKIEISNNEATSVWLWLQQM